MGCNNSKNVTVPINNNNLGSEGSSQEEEDEDGMFVKKRTWGSPAPPLPNIKSQGTVPDLFRATDHVAQTTRGGAAFIIQDENSQPHANPPRRLQKITGAKKMSMDELIRKQQDHDEKRKEQLRERVNRSNKGVNVKKREFERAQQKYSQAEKKQKQVEDNRQRIIELRINKAKEHNKKVQLGRSNKSVLRDNDNLNLSGKIEHDTEYNKSESESWDNESLKNIYDQMDYIPGNSASAIKREIVNNINHSDDEFFS